MSTPRGNPRYLQPFCNQEATISSRAFIDRSRDVQFRTPLVTSEDAANPYRPEGLPPHHQQLFGNHNEPMSWAIQRPFDLDHATPGVPR